MLEHLLGQPMQVGLLAAEVAEAVLPLGGLQVPALVEPAGLIVDLLLETPNELQLL